MSLSQEERMATHRIFNTVIDIVGTRFPGYHGRKTFDQAIRFVSENHWIMFPTVDINDIDAGKEAFTPNVYISFRGNVPLIMDDLSGNVTNGFIGLTFYNKLTMEVFQSIISRRGQQFINIFNTLGIEWEFQIQHKIKLDFGEPEYRLVRSFPASTVSLQDIREGLIEADASKLYAGDSYENRDVVWCVPVIVIWKVITPGSFHTDILNIFERFFGVLRLM